MAEHSITANDLAALPLFTGETPEQLEWLVPMCSVRTLRRGQTLLTPKHFDDRIYVVLGGRLQVQLDERGSSILDQVEPGQWVGEMSVLEGLPPSAHVMAAVGTRLLAVEGQALRTLLEYSAPVAGNMLHALSRRLRRDNLLVGHSMLQQRVSEADARLDPLTGLHNRRWLDESLRDLLGHYKAQGGQFSVMMLDLDRFKPYNDIHGHLAGDRALANFAAVVQRQVRTGDQVARFGGEELVALLPDTDLEEAQAVAERVRTAVREAPVTDHDGTPLPSVTVSIGLAAWRPGDTPQGLLDRVDAALYRAKAEGRDRVSR